MWDLLVIYKGDICGRADFATTVPIAPVGPHKAYLSTC
jgi:hypothetical protein